MPFQQITVRCPQCGQECEARWRPSVNWGLDNFDDEYLDKVSKAT
jgi:hypothetical protein